MTATVTERPAPAPGAPRPEPWRKERERWRIKQETAESIGIFVLWAGAYFALGVWLIRAKHLIVFDGYARLSHAYFVWWNSPPKLTAIGFVWPPIATLVFLPFAAIKPLATSLLALPLTSAVFGALLLVMIDRLFVVAGMRRAQRYPLVAAFGLNPMIVFYATNGMAEIVYLFFLLTATYAFFRWYLTRRPGALILSSVCFAIGILSRYEVFTWAVVIGVAIAFTSIRQRVTRAELEGTMLAYLAPVAYGVGIWLFFNWLILRDPLFFLKQQVPGAGINNPDGAQAVLAAPAGTTRPAQLAENLARLNLELFPALVIVLAALVLVLYRRRDLMTLALVAILVLNTVFTFLIVYESGALSYLQLRYNMRAMPLALVGMAWLFVLAPRRGKQWVWAASLVALVVSIPFTLHTMQTYRFQYLELNFVAAVLHDRGIGYKLGADDQMAHYIRAHVTQRDAVLTDDSQTFSVMLRSGRPDLFWDRIDKGDPRWREVLARPWGHVSYFLLVPGGSDLISARYPELSAGRSAPGLKPVLNVGKYELVRVAAAPPLRRRDVNP